VSRPVLFATLIALAVPAYSQAPYGLTARIPNSSLLPTSSGYPLGEMRLRQVFADAYLDRPVFLTHAGDGKDRIFVCMRRGRVRVFPNQEGPLVDRTFLDLRDRVNAGPSEGGLLSLAFHPQYAANGRFFVFYTHSDFYTRVSEFRVSADDPESADPGSERVLLDLRQPASNHNGGMLAFGPDGYLYVGLGDGGGSGDRYGNGQDPTTLLGAILRLDTDGAAEGAAYAIPPDNPFAGTDQGWRPEIWAYGLRNPWRFSFDRLTGNLWAGDVGQNAWEEIDLIQAGGNYGWNVMEGSHCYPPGADCRTDGLIPPVFEYSHDTGRSITGGYVYRGTRWVRLLGTYVYADYSFRTIWGLRYEDGMVTEHQVLARSPFLVSSFGEDEAGELYVVSLDGRIFVFDDATGAPAGNIPTTISASGLYSDTAAEELAPGILPYSVNSPLWSDGTYKSRFLALPNTAQIEFSRDGHWQFPSGTVLVKNFYVQRITDDPASRQLVETRFLIKRQDEPTWDGFSYRWDEEATDAVLLEGSSTRTLTIADPDAPGGSRELDYFFPSRAQCNLCHTPAAGYVLGVLTAQLNGTHDYGGTSDHQLRALNHVGLFTRDIGEDYAGFPRLASLDAAESLTTRARSYLEANCANCHQPGGNGRVNMDLRSSVALGAAGLIDVAPVLDDLGIAGAARIAPGSPATSVLLQRMLRLDQTRMPPLATSRVDAEATAVIDAWIMSLNTSTEVGLDAGAQPPTLALYPNHPNPFNPSTAIRFTLGVPTHVRLEVYSLLGQRLMVLVDGRRDAGLHYVHLDANGLGSGVYLYRLAAAGYSTSRKMVLLP
jgi:uncharacterized repeat protein (TIGR03806 family)